MEVRYTADRGVRLRDLDDATLAFAPLSWDVHILNPAAAAVLRACVASPQDRRSIARLLAELTDVVGTAQAQQQSADLLDELARLGLLQPVA